MSRKKVSTKMVKRHYPTKGRIVKQNGRAPMNPAFAYRLAIVERYKKEKVNESGV